MIEIDDGEELAILARSFANLTFRKTEAVAVVIMFDCKAEELVCASATYFQG